MLLIQATLRRNCKAGTDLSQKREKARVKVATDMGERLEPVYECVFVEGLPFGYAMPIEAPADLQAGDVVRVDQEDRAVYQVLRDGVVVWEHSAKAAQELEKSAARRARYMHTG